MRLFLTLLVTVTISACGQSAQSDSQLLTERGQAYPTGPDDEMTPGSLCDKPDTFRYAEKIAYCERDVDSSTKWEIIRTYDRTFGYRIETMDRQDFKIDHYIPLCMGGSNRVNNLWPQHKSVYVQTDGIEQKACELMAKGRLRQADAVKLIREVKNNLTISSKVESQLDAQLQ